MDQGTFIPMFTDEGPPQPWVCNKCKQQFPAGTEAGVLIIGTPVTSANRTCKACHESHERAKGKTPADLSGRNQSDDGTTRFTMSMLTAKQLKTGNDRLAKVAKHLDKMPPARFSFAHVLKVPCTIDISDLPRQRKKWTCGGVGCAIGEFPIIFPRHFKYLVTVSVFDEQRLLVAPVDHPDHINLFFVDTVPLLAKFFYMTTYEFVNVFVPKEAYPGWETRSDFDEWRWIGLSDSAEPQELAALIREVIADRVADHVAEETYATQGQ